MRQLFLNRQEMRSLESSTFQLKIWTSSENVYGFANHFTVPGVLERLLVMIEFFDEYCSCSRSLWFNFCRNDWVPWFFCRFFLDLPLSSASFLHDLSSCHLESSPAMPQLHWKMVSWIGVPFFLVTKLLQKKSNECLVNCHDFQR